MFFFVFKKFFKLSKNICVMFRFTQYVFFQKRNIIQTSVVNEVKTNNKSIKNIFEKNVLNIFLVKVEHY